MQDHGYIALYRTVFGHRLFKDEKPFTRLHAWAWLIAKAAWAPKQERVGRTIATLDRGQLAATLRDLGTTWGWSLGKTQRFLATLRREAMIRTLVPDTKADTKADTLRSTQYTIITICNYSSFQSPPKDEDAEPIRKAARRPIRGTQQTLDLDDEIPPQPYNHKTKDKRSLEKSWEKRGTAGKTVPKHGQRGRGHIFWHHGTPEWEIYADDFRAKRGLLPMPNTYADGRGRWFKEFGETGDRTVLWSAERIAKFS
jgi:hypothetical protein